MLIGERTPLSNPNEAHPHICKGIATAEMWWELSSSIKTSNSRCSQCEGIKPRKVKDGTRHDSSFVMKKNADSFDMSNDFSLSFFDEEEV